MIWNFIFVVWVICIFQIYINSNNNQVLYYRIFNFRVKILLPHSQYSPVGCLSLPRQWECLCTRECVRVCVSVRIEHVPHSAPAASERVSEWVMLLRPVRDVDMCCGDTAVCSCCLAAHSLRMCLSPAFSQSVKSAKRGGKSCIFFLRGCEPNTCHRALKKGKCLCSLDEKIK